MKMERREKPRKITKYLLGRHPTDEEIERLIELLRKDAEAAEAAEAAADDCEDRQRDTE